MAETGRAGEGGGDASSERDEPVVHGAAGDSRFGQLDHGAQGLIGGESDGCGEFPGDHAAPGRRG